MDRVDRREQYAGKTGKPDRDRGERHHVGRQRDAERTDHVGVLYARTHHMSEGGAVQQHPERRDAQHGDCQQGNTVARGDEVADDHLPAQPDGDRAGEWQRAEDHPQRLLGNRGEAEGQ
jgi:hypothetical protein